MKKATKLKFTQLGILTAIWMILDFLISVYDHLVLIGPYSAGTTSEYSFLLAAGLNIASGLTAALLGGTFMVFFVNVKYQDKPYGYTILAVSIGLIIVVALIATIMGIIM